MASKFLLIFKGRKPIGAVPIKKKSSLRKVNALGRSLKHGLRGKVVTAGFLKKVVLKLRPRAKIKAGRRTRTRV